MDKLFSANLLQCRGKLSSKTFIFDWLEAGGSASSGAEKASSEVQKTLNDIDAAKNDPDKIEKIIEAELARLAQKYKDQLDTMKNEQKAALKKMARQACEIDGKSGQVSSPAETALFQQIQEKLKPILQRIDTGVDTAKREIDAVGSLSGTVINEIKTGKILPETATLLGEHDKVTIAAYNQYKAALERKAAAKKDFTQVQAKIAGLKNDLNLPLHGPADGDEVYSAILRDIQQKQAIGTGYQGEDAETAARARFQELQSMNDKYNKAASAVEQSTKNAAAAKDALIGAVGAWKEVERSTQTSRIVAGTDVKAVAQQIVDRKVDVVRGARHRDDVAKERAAAAKENAKVAEELRKLGGQLARALAEVHTAWTEHFRAQTALNGKMKEYKVAKDSPLDLENVKAGLALQEGDVAWGGPAHTRDIATSIERGVPLKRGVPASVEDARKIITEARLGELQRLKNQEQAVQRAVDQQVVAVRDLVGKFDRAKTEFAKTVGQGVITEIQASLKLPPRETILAELQGKTGPTGTPPADAIARGGAEPASPKGGAAIVREAPKPEIAKERKTDAIAANWSPENRKGPTFSREQVNKLNDAKTTNMSVTKDGVNVRDAETGAVIATLNKDARVVLPLKVKDRYSFSLNYGKRNENFVKIIWKGGEAYVAAKYLE